MSRILLVDQSDGARSVLPAMLEDVGHEVFEARDGDELLRMAAAIAPDAILLDEARPSEDGFRNLQRLKSRLQTARIPVVIVTGAAALGDHRLAISLGAADFVTPPWGDGEIELRLHWVLNSGIERERPAGRMLSRLSPVTA